MLFSIHPTDYIRSLTVRIVLFKELGGEWSEMEHDLFLKGYEKYQKNWVMISKEYVKTRTRQQVRNHAVKYFLKQEKKENPQ
jgi:SHAQKYF class myb-like DNA-binding protein